MTPEQLHAIEDRLNAATPGPWVSVWSEESGGLTDDPEYPLIHTEDGEPVIQLTYYDGHLIACLEDDASLIAHAPEDLRVLVEEVRRLQEILKVREELVDAAQKLFLSYDIPVGSGLWEAIQTAATMARDSLALRAQVKRLAQENALLIQTTGDLCPVCGWRTKFPHGCDHCKVESLTKENASLTRALDEAEEDQYIAEECEP